MRSPCAYRSRRIDPAGLKLRLRELAHSRPGFGYRRLHVMLRREGCAIKMKAYGAYIGWKACNCACGCGDANTRACSAVWCPRPVGTIGIEALDRVLAAHGTPASITVGHGMEFTSRAVDEWAYRLGIKLDFTRPGKPTDNRHVESPNGRLRDECLNVCEFLSIEDARSKIEQWRDDYNHRRPHRSLGHLTPSKYVQRGQRERTQKPGNPCSGSI